MSSEVLLYDLACEVVDNLEDALAEVKEVSGLAWRKRGPHGSLLTDEDKNTVRKASHDVVLMLRAASVMAEALKEQANKL